MKKNAREDYTWFTKQPLSRYEGTYVAIAGKKVVASGYNAVEVYKKAKRKTRKLQPIIAKTPSEDTMVLFKVAS